MKPRLQHPSPSPRHYACACGHRLSIHAVSAVYNDLRGHRFLILPGAVLCDECGEEMDLREGSAYTRDEAA